MRRVAIVDLDVHQGNGTAHMLRREPEVFTLSVHQESNYPMPKERCDLDVGLEDGTGDDGVPAGARAGARARVGAAGRSSCSTRRAPTRSHDDQLGGLALTIAGLEARDRLVLEGCAARGIPVVLTLGGGYARRVEDTVRIHLASCRIALASVLRRRETVPGEDGA